MSSSEQHTLSNNRHLSELAVEPLENNPAKAVKNNPTTEAEDEGKEEEYVDKGQVDDDDAILTKKKKAAKSKKITKSPSSGKDSSPAGKKPSAKGKSAGSRKLAAPSSMPVVTNENGIEWITFNYSVKGSLTDYKIRTDVDSIPLPDIPPQFKHDNCVYPRACCAESEYTGNRWNYENTVNTLGWKLCFLNPTQLCGKRGLIQRAVDSYRNRFPEMRSRRVVRQEKLINGTLRRRSENKTDEPELDEGDIPLIAFKSATKKRKIVYKDMEEDEEEDFIAEKIEYTKPTSTRKRKTMVYKEEPLEDEELLPLPMHQEKDDDDEEFQQESYIPPSPIKPSPRRFTKQKPKPGRYLTFETIVNSNPVTHRIRVDIESVDISEIPAEFAYSNTVFPRVHNLASSSYTFGPLSRWEYETNVNALSIKLAWLNNCTLAGKRCLLQRAVDFFRLEMDGNIYGSVVGVPRSGKRMVQQLKQRRELKYEIEGVYTRPIKDEVSAAAVDLLAVGFGGTPPESSYTLEDDDDDDEEEEKDGMEMDADSAAALLQNFFKSG